MTVFAKIQAIEKNDSHVGKPLYTGRPDDPPRNDPVALTLRDADRIADFVPPMPESGPGHI